MNVRPADSSAVIYMIDKIFENLNNLPKEINAAQIEFNEKLVKANVASQLMGNGTLVDTFV